MWRIWLNFRYRINRLFMCRHDRACLDALIFGQGQYVETPKEWYGVGLPELFVRDLAAQLASAKEHDYENRKS